LHEKQFNDVHNQGAALINQRHPAGEVIEVRLNNLFLNNVKNILLNFASRFTCAQCKTSGIGC
jgi:hypothetical protein